MEEMNISFGSFYKRASFWRNRKKMNKRGCGGHAPAEWQNLQKQWQNLQNLHLQAKNYCRFRMTDGKPFKRYTDDIPLWAQNIIG